MHRSGVAFAGGLILAFCQPMLGASLLAQGNAPQAQRVDPIRSRRATVISADDHGAETRAVPRPDLVPQRMCLTPPGAGRELRILVANRGPVDADSFSVGLRYGYGRADTVVAMVKGIGGLAAGRTAWFSYEPTFLTSSLPATYTALVDPRYTYQYSGYDRDGNSFTATAEVAPLVAEANEHNNTLTLARTAIAGCGGPMRQGARPAQVNPR
jgi:hypothetical protein